MRSSINEGNTDQLLARRLIIVVFDEVVHANTRADHRGPDEQVVGVIGPFFHAAAARVAL